VRMITRWDRSNLRECYVQLSYMFKRYRHRHRLLPIVDFFIRELELPLTFIFIPILLVNICLYPLLLLKVMTAMAVVSFVLTAYYISAEKDMDFVYGIVYSYYAFFLLKWIKPYAFLTLRDGRWLTR
ncbi:MAG: hypothetical protein ACYDIC_11855, partial [Desulfobaccales bacterium]